MATALYRRYRPESFAEVIGQDHVTVPLMRALRSGRIGHAYLFSGPRGCGKTTSARILARCLNCEQGPTDTPCGVCDSCRDLARGGPGSLDVVEIDAASHGGVDDARELRERATFAPARDRFKVFIIDEAHMVTSAGFNALLKLVEEPPEHVKFIFATTEPDKVIGTIRSRTHHYPFRLIPPQILGPYLDSLCQAEGVQVSEGVLPLVVRAGGGSARDTLSVLDQLMAGAGEDGVDYQTAINLLGFTDTALLDRAITAIGTRDAAGLYGAVEQVLATGHEPRRFVEDLLERLRDLIVLAAVPERGHELLPEVPADELAGMREQLAVFTPVELSLCGDLVNQALSTMTGATSPRLHLELLAARLLLRGAQVGAPQVGQAALGGQAPQGGRVSQGGEGQASAPRGAGPGPSAGHGQDGPGARSGAGASGREQARQIAQEQAEAARRAREEQAPARSARPQVEPVTEARGAAAPAPASGETASPAPSAERAPAVSTQDDGWGPVAAIPGAESTAGEERRDARPASSGSAADASAVPDSSPSPANVDHAAGGEDAPAPVGPEAAATEGGLQIGTVRESWAQIMEALQQIRRPSWALVSQHAHASAVRGGTLVISFRNPGLLGAFQRGTGAENLAQAVQRVLRAEVSIEAIVEEDPDGGSGGSGPSGSAGPGPGAAEAPRAARGAGVGMGTDAARGAGVGMGTDAARGAGAGSGADEGPRGGGAARVDAPAQPPSREAVPAAGVDHAQGAPGRAARSSSGTDRRTAEAPPEPEDAFPPEPDDFYPPEPDDGWAPAGMDHGGSVGTRGPQVSRMAQRSGGAQDSEGASAPTVTDDASGTSRPQASDEVLEVHDEGRDQVPEGEPRTHGQAALRLAIAEGRVVRSLPPVAGSGAATGDASGGRAGGVAPAGGDADGAQVGEDAGHAPAGSVAADMPADHSASGAPAPSPSSPPTPVADGGWGDDVTVAIPGGAREESPSVDDPASAAAGVSTDAGLRTDAGGPARSAQSSAPRGQSGATARNGQGQASRTGGAGPRGRGQQTAPAPEGAEEDLTGGASRDDEDAVVVTRSGRQIAESVLGGRVLEIIDESR